jgi:hypothetical protein
MATLVTVEAAQHNFYQYVRQLVDGSLDRLNMKDGADGTTIASMVPWASFTAADPSGSAGVEYDVVAAYSGLPAVYKGPLYKLVKNMRDRQAAADAVQATGSLAIPAGGGGAIIDAETFTLTNTAGTATVFEFDVGGGGITGDVAVVITGAENQAALSALVFGAINGAGIDITAVDNGTSVGLTQDTAGTAGNVTITETVVDVGFVAAGFAGGTDVPVEGGVVALRYSKNDTAPVVALLPYDHANAIGL